MSSKTTFEVRNLKFGVDGVRRFWHGERKSVTQFWNNLSIFFPAGERFFIASVKAHKDLVKDPQLAAEVRAFYGQEGVHTREHERYNELLRAQGYPIEEMDARVEKLLAFVAKILPDRFELGVTCALEHFTAMLADWVLSEKGVMEGADANMAALWRWHAAEENEHKAVAFDVFKTAGGWYLERAIIMAVATIIFWGKVLEHQVRLMKHDGNLWQLSEWTGLFKYLFISPGGMGRLIPAYLDYFKPSFHPWDHDNRALLEQWKETLETDEVYVEAQRGFARAAVAAE